MSFGRIVRDCSRLYKGNAFKHLHWMPFERSITIRRTIQPQYHRSYCQKAPRYFMGKKIEEEVEELFLHEYLLLTIQSYDEAVVDSYVSFVQNAAKMTNVNLTKNFNMPATKASYRIRSDPRETESYKQEFSLKKYQRIVEFQGVTEDKCDVLIQYLRESLPCGVDLKLELKRWEELVAPGHPSLQKIQTPSYTGKRASS